MTKLPPIADPKMRTWFRFRPGSRRDETQIGVDQLMAEGDRHGARLVSRTNQARRPSQDNDMIRGSNPRNRGSLTAAARPVVDHPHIRALLELLAESATDEPRPKP
jgi:hypothetical protein